MKTKRTFGTWTPIKTIRSHIGVSRFLAQAAVVGEIRRVPEIPSPYSYSPTWTVYAVELPRKGYTVNRRWVFVRETSHKLYHVFLVPEGTKLETEAPFHRRAERLLDQARATSQVKSFVSDHFEFIKVGD